MNAQHVVQPGQAAMHGVTKPAGCSGFAARWSRCQAWPTPFHGRVSSRTGSRSISRTARWSPNRRTGGWHKRSVLRPAGPPEMPTVTSLGHRLTFAERLMVGPPALRASLRGRRTTGFHRCALCVPTVVLSGSMRFGAGNGRVNESAVDG